MIVVAVLIVSTVLTAIDYSRKKDHLGVRNQIEDPNWDNYCKNISIWG
jgi:hypothetical protein